MWGRTLLPLAKPETAYAGPSRGFSSSGVSSVTKPIGWRPAQCSRSSWALEQRLPRWRWSISKAFGRVTETDLRLASPACGVQVELQGGVLAAGGELVAAELGDRHLRGEGEGRAVDRVEVGGEVATAVPWSPIPSEATEKGRAVGRVDHEVRLVDVDLDFAHPDRDPADDLGHRF